MRKFKKATTAKMSHAAHQHWFYGALLAAARLKKL